MRRIFVDLVTLLRVPVIILLAFVVGPDNADLAIQLLVLGILSQWIDGFLVRTFKLTESKPGEFWHEADTAWLSLGLQLGAAAWLCRADALPLWVVPVYVIIVLAIEFGYVQPRKAKQEPYVPVVLFGSFVVWACLIIQFGAEADIDPFRTVLFLFGMTVLSPLIHEQVWQRWRYEWTGEPSLAPPYRS